MRVPVSFRPTVPAFFRSVKNSLRIYSQFLLTQGRPGAQIQGAMKRFSRQQIASLVERLKPGDHFLVSTARERTHAINAGAYQGKEIVTKHRKEHNDYIILALP